MLKNDTSKLEKLIDSNFELESRFIEGNETIWSETEGYFRYPQIGHLLPYFNFTE